LYSLHAAVPSYSPQQLLQLLELMPAWRTPPGAAVNARNALLRRWFAATQQAMLRELQQLHQHHNHQQQQGRTSNLGSTGDTAAAAAAGAEVQVPVVAPLLKGLAAAHIRPPEQWMATALASLTQHIRAAQQQQQQVQQQQEMLPAGLLQPEEVSRVVLALSKLGCRPEGVAAEALLQATQVSNTNMHAKTPCLQYVFVFSMRSVLI
jgi:hypothetical protein